ncbi:MAG: integrin alpha [Bacteroidota bacterium]
MLTNLQLQVSTLYGYTVAGLGDINHDGYDDAAISAPGMANVVAGAGNLANVGAVFIYLGDSTGLSPTPVKYCSLLLPCPALYSALV